MRSFAALLALLLAGCASAATEQAPAPSGRIDGAVVDRFLQPYARLNVTLADPNGAGAGRVDATSELGGFTFRAVPPGIYTLAASHPGTLGDTKVVEVEAGRITRIILQLLPVPSTEPFVGSLNHKAHADLALPGSECSSCAWETFPQGQPEEVVLRMEWDGLPAGSSAVQARLLDQDGRLLGSAAGPSPLELVLGGDRLPAGLARVKVQVHFPDGFTPQPFDLRSTLDLYYHAPRAAQGQSTQ